MLSVLLKMILFLSERIVGTLKTLCVFLRSSDKWLES